jgi:hypothetical protein
MSMIRCSFCIGRGWKILFKHVQAVQDIDEGYAFKFRFSNHLIRRLADYADFENRHGSPLTFTLRVKPCDGEMWFQVRGPAGEKERIRTVYIPLRGNGHSGSKTPSQFY